MRTILGFAVLSAFVFSGAVHADGKNKSGVPQSSRVRCVVGNAHAPTSHKLTHRNTAEMFIGDYFSDIGVASDSGDAQFQVKKDLTPDELRAKKFPCIGSKCLDEMTDEELNAVQENNPSSLDYCVFAKLEMSKGSTIHSLKVTYGSEVNQLGSSAAGDWPCRMSTAPSIVITRRDLGKPVVINEHLAIYCTGRFGKTYF